MGFQISTIHDDAARLRAWLGDEPHELRIAPDAPLDAAGAQLLAAASMTASARGTPLALHFTDGTDNLALWRRLALDAVIETRVSASSSPHPDAAA